MGTTKKKIKNVFLFGAMIVFALLFGFCAVPKTAMAEDYSGSVAIMFNDAYSQKSTVTIDYSSIEKITKTKLLVQNYTFTVGQKVTYLYIDNNGDDVMYNLIKSVEISIGNKNDAACECNFLNKLGSGSFTIKAIVTSPVADGEVIVDFPTTLTLRINPPTLTSLNFEIKQTAIDRLFGDYGKYKFELKAKNITSEKMQVISALLSDIDLENYSISWIATPKSGGESFVIGSGNSIEWEPPTNQTYTISAQFLMENSNNQANQIIVKTDFAVDYSIYAIIALVVLAVLLGVTVAIVTIVKVKKERVW